MGGWLHKPLQGSAAALPREVPLPRGSCRIMSVLVKQEPPASVPALLFPGGNVGFSSVVERLQANCDSRPGGTDWAANLVNLVFYSYLFIYLFMISTVKLQFFSIGQIS